MQGLVQLPEGYRLESRDPDVLVVQSAEADAILASGITSGGFPTGAEAVSLRGRGTMYRIPLQQGQALVRPARHGGLLRFLTEDRFSDPYRPVRELALTAGLRAEGIPAPEPIAAAAVRRGRYYRLFYVSREVSGQDLYAFLGSEAPLERRMDALRKAGAVIRNLHEHGVLHVDLHPKNLFVEDGTGDVLVLDLDRTERGGVPSRPARLENLVRFYRFGKRREALGEGSGWEDDELRALLDGYTRGDPGALHADLLEAYRKSSLVHRIGWRLEVILHPAAHRNGSSNRRP